MSNKGKKNICAACPNILKNVDFLQCSRCKGQYHYTCMNFSASDYEGFSSDFKAAWVCLTCRCKEPKTGNNCNTPVRPAPTSQSHHYDNVTLRVKQSGATVAENIAHGCSCLKATEIRKIIREELHQIIQTEINSELQDIKKGMASFEETTSFFNEEFEKIKASNCAQNARIVTLEKEKEILQTTTHDLTAKLRQLDQQTRATNLELQCVPEHKHENLVSTLIQLSKVIKCPINDSDIQYCSRVAKLNPSSHRPRSILVKLRSPRLRDTFLAATSSFNKNHPHDKLNTSHLGLADEKKSPVYVVEHLTLENKELHSATRRKCKELHYKFVWVRDGKIFVRKNEEANYIHIRNSESLQKLN